MRSFIRITLLKLYQIRRQILRKLTWILITSVLHIQVLEATSLNYIQIILQVLTLDGHSKTKIMCIVSKSLWFHYWVKVYLNYLRTFRKVSIQDIKFKVFLITAFIQNTLEATGLLSDQIPVLRNTFKWTLYLLNCEY